MFFFFFFSLSHFLPMIYRLPTYILICLYHGTHIRWYLRNRCARKELSMELFVLFKACDQIKSSHKSVFFPIRPIFLDTCSKLPSNISTMGGIDKKHQFGRLPAKIWSTSHLYSLNQEKKIISDAKLKPERKNKDKLQEQRKRQFRIERDKQQ